MTSVLPNEAAILSAHPTRYVDFLRVRLDPLRSKDVQQRLLITLRDRDIRCALEVRRGVCEFIDHVDQDRPDDLVLNLQHADWARFYIGETNMAELLEQGRAQSPQTGAVIAFFALFDSADSACGRD